MLQPYRVSNRVSPLGLVVLLAAVVVIGVALGIGAHFVSRAVWLIILFPILFGLVGGFLLALVVTSQHVRSPLVALLAGLLFGVIMFASYQYGDYLKFRSDFAAAILEESPEASPAQIDEFIDLVLTGVTFDEAEPASEPGPGGFLGYLNIAAKEGVSISRRGSETAIKGVGTWIYWLVELLIIGGVAAAMARSAAKKPYCESCGRWFSGKTPLSSLDMQRGAELVNILRAGDARAAAGYMGAQFPQTPRVDAGLQTCAQPDLHPSYLVVETLSFNNKGKAETKELLVGLLDPRALAEFRRPQAPPAQAPAPASF